MVSRSSKLILLLGTVAQLTTFTPALSPAHAQAWGDRRVDWRDHPDNRNWGRHDWEHQRRKDAKTDGVVAGVVGTAAVVGLVAAIANAKKERKERERAAYCQGRYGNYDPDSDGYHASDGRIYQCQ